MWKRLGDKDFIKTLKLHWSIIFPLTMDQIATCNVKGFESTSNITVLWACSAAPKWPQKNECSFKNFASCIGNMHILYNSFKCLNCFYLRLFLIGGYMQNVHTCSSLNFNFNNTLSVKVSHFALLFTFFTSYRQELSFFLSFHCCFELACLEMVVMVAK